MKGSYLRGPLPDEPQPPNEPGQSHLGSLFGLTQTTLQLLGKRALFHMALSASDHGLLVLLNSILAASATQHTVSKVALKSHDLSTT